jgi:hypothetical protein
MNRCRAPVSALHSPVFARLASGAFYETIVYGIFNDSKTQDSVACPGPDPGFAE